MRLAVPRRERGHPVRLLVALMLEEDRDVLLADVAQGDRART
jgi:hypothetical protein